MRCPADPAVPIYRREELHGQRPDHRCDGHSARRRRRGFCIVSSDSDYTRLVPRVREQGLFGMGVDRSTTPKAFVNACEVFVYLENLVPQQEYDNDEGRGLDLSDWTEIASCAIEMSMQDDGWAFLGAVRSRLRQLDPAFDSRSYRTNAAQNRQTDWESDRQEWLTSITGGSDTAGGDAQVFHLLSRGHSLGDKSC